MLRLGGLPQPLQTSLPLCTRQRLVFKIVVVSHLEAMTKEDYFDLFPTVPPQFGILRAEGFCRN